MKKLFVCLLAAVSGATVPTPQPFPTRCLWLRGRRCLQFSGYQCHGHLGAALDDDNATGDVVALGFDFSFTAAVSRPPTLPLTAFSRSAIRMECAAMACRSGLAPASRTRSPCFTWIG